MQKIGTTGVDNSLEGKEDVGIQLKEFGKKKKREEIKKKKGAMEEE